VPARAQDHQPAAQGSVVAPQLPSKSSEPSIPKPLPAQISGISEEQVAEIKQAIQAQQKFLGELIEQATRWELDGAELRLYFPADKRSFAEMLEGREPLEKLRIASGKALGRAVRVCAKLEAVAAAAASASRGGPATQELRAQFERDPMVKSMLQRFGGKIAEVKHRPEET
jgi:shikimate kinase